MLSYGECPPLLEFPFRRPRVSLPELTEDPQISENSRQVLFDDLQRSTLQLREQVSALQVRNRELEEYAHMVAHDLKEPLSVMGFSLQA